MKLRNEKSCGCIIINDNKVLLVYEKNRNFWGFPKGHIEENENEKETALREVKEEVGLDVKIISEKRYKLHYIIRDEIDKTVILYLAKPINYNITKQEDEIEIAKWFNFEEAINTITFEHTKELFKKVLKDLGVNYGD